MKKQILTFAFLATVAIGAAVAGTKSSPNAKPITSGGGCVNNVTCEVGPAADCEYDLTPQSGEDGLGSCSTPLQRID